MPLNFGGGTGSTSSSVSTQQLTQQLAPYFIERTGDTISATNDKITTVPNPVNAQDPVNLQYLQNYVTSNSITSTNFNRNLYEPDFIRTQNPYFHFCADAYGSTEASIYDISTNNQSLTFSNFGGTSGIFQDTFSTGLNNHKYINFVNRGFNIGSTNASVYTCFAVIQYISQGTVAFIFGSKCRLVVI